MDFVDFIYLNSLRVKNEHDKSNRSIAEREAANIRASKANANRRVQEARAFLQSRRR